MADKLLKKEDNKSDTIDSPRPGTSKDPDWDEGAWGWSNPLQYKSSYSPLSLVTTVDHPILSCPSDSSVKVNLLEIGEDSNNPSSGSDRTIYVADEDEAKFSDDGNRIHFKVPNGCNEAYRTVEEVIMNAKQVKFGDVPPMKPTFVPTGVPFNPADLENLSDGEFSNSSEEPKISELPQTQFERAQKKFQKDEDFYALMYRPREWKKRKHFAILNFYEPVSMVSPKSSYLLYNTPVQILTFRPHPLDEETIIAYGLAVYIKPEILNTSHLYACDGAPISLTCETKPVYRNVFEIISPQKYLEGLPLQHKSVVYIKLFDKDQHKYFYLTCNNINENDKGKLFVTQTLDEFCEFEILPLDIKDNWRCAKIEEQMFIKHIISGTFVVAKISETVFNIFGEEKSVEAGNSTIDKTKLWTFSHGLPFEETNESEISEDVTEPLQIQVQEQEREPDSNFKRNISQANLVYDEFIFKKPKPVKNRSRTYF